MRFRKPSTSVALAVAAVAIVTLAPSAGASEFHAFDHRSQIHESEVVLLGTVTGLRSRWLARRLIVTEAAVEVEEVWKGDPAGMVTVRTLGGSIGDIELRVDGAVEFRQGERLVLFLRRSADGGYEPTGMVFGVWEIVDEAGEWIALGNLPPSRPDTGRYRSVSVAFDDLRDEVLALVRGGVR